MPRDNRLAEEFLTALEAMRGLEAGATAGAASIAQESIDHIRAMLGREDEGWDIWIGGHGQESGGFNLDDLRAWSKRLTPASNSSSWLARGFRLRSQFYWQGDIQYDKVPSESRGRGVNVQEKIDDLENKRAFFGKAARIRRERRLYCEGLALWVGEDATKKLKAIPLDQITGIFTAPDDPGIIWAYKREWSERKTDGSTKAMKRWYFVDTYKDRQVDYITVDKVREKVETGWTAFDMHVNTVEGWPLGMPDALSAWVWNEYAKDLYQDGMDVSEAMASIIFAASSGTKKGAANAANQLASPLGAGSSAAIGAAGDITAVSTAGKGYDFASIRHVLAVIATSLDVSTIHLTANPGDAGSSYGSAQTLDLPGRLAAESRRDEHVELDLRVLRWMAGNGDAGKAIKVYFLPLDDKAEQYRHIQSITMAWLQGVIAIDTYKELLADVLGVPDLGATPAGVLLPNNKASLPRKDIDRDGVGGAPSASAPSQGQSTGAGGDEGRPTDVRSDIQSN